MIMSSVGLSSGLPEIICQLSPQSTPPSPTIDRDSIKCSKSKLVLHFDVNETILIGDDAGGDTVEDCLNKIIAKSAFVKCPPDDSSSQTEGCVITTTTHYETSHWWNGAPIMNDQKVHQPPSPLYTGWQWPQHCCPYYRTKFKKYAKTFTLEQQHGSAYRPLYELLKNSFLQLPSNAIGGGANSNTDIESEDDSSLPPSHLFYRMLPSFFHTLVKLQEMNKDYTLVLRTFGDDLEDVALAIKDFAQGKHPVYPSFREPKLLLEECNMYRGRYRVEQPINGDDHGDGNRNSIINSIYDLFDWNDSSKVIASGDDELLNIIEGQSICGIQDDYKYWSGNDCVPSSGKPVWIHPKDEDGRVSYHHLIFDDNIHNDAKDSIVAVRSRDMHTRQWKSLSGENTIDQQGIYVVRVPTVAAILEQDWFLQQIAVAEARLHGHCTD